MLRTMWLLIRRLFAGRRNRPPLPGRRGLPRRAEDYLRLLDGHPGARITTVRLVGTRADADGRVFEHEHIETEDDDGNARQVDVYVGQMCSCGRVFDQDVRPAGVCHISGDLLCSPGPTGGCAAHCSICGRLCGPRHRTERVFEDGRTVVCCGRCLGTYLWRRFWGLI